VELLLALMIGRSKMQLQTNQVSNFDPCNVNAANYLAMLKEFFLPKWNDMLFHEESFLQQNGAPPHYANVVKDYLFGQRHLDLDGLVEV
jgi:hypothetical protein